MYWRKLSSCIFFVHTVVFTNETARDSLLDSDLDTFSRSNPGFSLVRFIVSQGFNSKLALIDRPIRIANYSELGIKILNVLKLF